MMVLKRNTSRVVGKCALSFLLIAAYAPVLHSPAPTAFPVAANGTNAPVPEPTPTRTMSIASDQKLASKLDAFLAGLAGD